MTGEQVLELLLGTFSCARERTMGRHTVVVCRDCPTTVLVTEDEYAPTDLEILEEQLRRCLGAKLARALGLRP